MTMDYSPWSEREIWPFLKVAISLKPEWQYPSKLVCMHNTFTSTCMNFFSRFQMIKFLDDRGLSGADPGFATRGGCPNLGGSGGMPPQENFENFTPLKGNFEAFQIQICLS